MNKVDIGLISMSVKKVDIVSVCTKVKKNIRAVFNKVKKVDAVSLCMYVKMVDTGVFLGRVNGFYKRQRVCHRSGLQQRKKN